MTFQIRLRVRNEAPLAAMWVLGEVYYFQRVTFVHFYILS